MASTKITLTNDKILESHKAIQKFENVIFSGRATISLILVIKTLKDQADVLEQTRIKLAKQFVPSGQAPAESPEVRNFINEWTQVLKDGFTFNYTPVELTLDQVDKAQVPPASWVVLSWLFSIKDEEMETPKEEVKVEKTEKRSKKD